MFASKDVFLTPPSGGYTIARSVRLRSSATAYLNRTLTTPTNNQKWTYSCWIKRGSVSNNSQGIFESPSSGSTFASIYFTSGDIINWYEASGGATVYILQTSQVFRDPSAWYHLVCVYDSTQATSSNRQKMYVNGVQITAFSTATYVAQNTNGRINSAVAHKIGTFDASSNYLDGYITEVNFIDGQALTPSSFGSTNAITGVWQPAKYTGTYGTNGFYLNFSDNSSNTATTIGKDYSGNGNNWTPNNISVTAGATYDSMTDVPTLTSATAANFCTLNPIAPGDYFASGQTAFALTNGNLFYGATGRNAFGSIAVSSGKWYWEMVNTSNTTAATALFGLVTVASRTAVYACYYNAVNGNKGLGTLNSGATETAYGATWTDNDVIGVAVDMSAATPTVTFYKNNTSQGAISVSSFVGQSVMMWIQNGGNTNNMSGNVNFGQRPFTYTPPTDYVALNTYNLPDSTIKNGAGYMAAKLYTGNTPSTNAITGIGFAPDLAWVKSRDNAQSHNLVDKVRGNNLRLRSNTTDAEASATFTLDSDGFTVGANSESNVGSMVGWLWKAGGTSASNTNGSITSTVNVGATQGFSVVTYTSTTGTVGHGLGVAPSMIIMKARNNVDQWTVGHVGLPSWSYGLALNATSAQDLNTAFWNGTAPTSTVFSQGSWDSGFTKVAYCFSAVKGFSAFGSYTGNGSASGNFIYTGFRPRFVLMKNTTTAGNGWIMQDSSRSPYNVVNAYLAAESSGAEGTGVPMDILSNGFRLTSSSQNDSGANFIYMAFAENPFKNALAR